MKTRHFENPGAPPVLRGVVLHAQPHALARPGRATNPIVAKAPAQAMPAATNAAIDSAFAKGREEGYDLGYQAGGENERLHALTSIAQARDRAMEEGRQAGLQQGLADASSQVQLQHEAWRLELEQAQQARAQQVASVLGAACAELVQWRAAWEDELVELTHDALCRLLGSDAARAPVVRSMVRHLLAEQGARSQLAVHVHPDDLAALELERGQGDEVQWQWVPDRSIELGGIILRSPQGSLDARLETQMAALRETLLAVRAGRRALPDQQP